MRRSIITALLAAATTFVATAPSSAQTYVMRGRLPQMPIKATTPPGPKLLSNCTLTINTTTQNAVNFHQVGNSTGYATLAEAKAACDAEAVGLCYADYHTGSPYDAKVASGRPYWAYAMTSGSTTPISGVAGKTVYAGYCTPR